MKRIKVPTVRSAVPFTSTTNSPSNSIRSSRQLLLPPSQSRNLTRRNPSRRPGFCTSINQTRFFLLLLLRRRFPPHEVHPPAEPYSAPPERNPRSEFSVDRSEYVRYALHSSLAEPPTTTRSSGGDKCPQGIDFFFSEEGQGSGRLYYFGERGWRVIMM